MAVVGGSNTESEGFSEINVTPLTDVLLVLLIIFLITASSITAPTHPIELPTVVTREQAEHSQIVVDITADGSAWIGADAYPGSALQTQLQKLALSQRTDRILVNADQEAPYGSVLRALAAAREAGLEDVGLATTLDEAAGRPKVKVIP